MAVWENVFHAFLLASGVAGNPWCTLDYRCITPTCLCCHMIFSPVSLSPCVFFSYKETSHIGLMPTLLQYEVILMTMTLFPNKVTIWGSGKDKFWRDTVQLNTVFNYSLLRKSTLSAVESASPIMNKQTTSILKPMDLLVIIIILSGNMIPVRMSFASFWLIPASTFCPSNLQDSFGFMKFIYCVMVESLIQRGFLLMCDIT